MALARLCMTRFPFHQRVFSWPLYNASTRMTTTTTTTAPPNCNQRWKSQLGRISAASETSGHVPVEKSDARDVEVSKARGERSKLSPRNRRGLWRSRRDIAPFGLNDIFRPSAGFGLGNALMQMTETLNKMFENINWTPPRLFGRMKEDGSSYKLRFEVPGLSKEDIKITVEDGYLMMKGEHKEAEEESSDEDQWYSRSYGYYNTSLLLPEDAKVEEIKAELKDGILSLTIPRSEVQKKEVKEVEIK